MPRQHPGRFGHTGLDVPAPFSVEMSQGCIPQASRRNAPTTVNNRLGWSVTQLTHVPAPVSDEMMQGSAPHKARQPFVAKIGWQVSQTTHVQAPISIEMLAGSAPNRSRTPIISHIGWSVSQTTHVAAPLSIEMFIGVGPTQARRTFVSRQINLDASWNEVTVVAATFVNAQFVMMGFGPTFYRAGRVF